MTRDEALRIVDLLYAAALGEAKWSLALKRISDTLGGSAATLEMHDVSKPKLVFFDSIGIDLDSIDIYLRDFAATNSRVRFMLKSGRRIGFDQLFITEEEMDRDPFYVDFLRLYDLRYFLAAQTPLIDGRLRSVLTVQRSGRVRGVPQEHLAFMRLLSPHVDRAVGLFWTRMRLEIDPDHLDCVLARYGLTPAERRLAAALALGEGLPCYARCNRLSMNTVYTHYRHVKEKLDAPHLTDLVLRLRAM